MQGPSHLMLSRYFAEATDVITPRDRRIVAWSGFAPDFDVLAYVGALVYYGLDKDLAFENVWRVVHHRYTHGVLYVLLIGVVAYFLASGSGGARGRLQVALLATLMGAMHCFLDVVGGGPTWPIYPFWPFTETSWHASWSWTIGEWPNVVVLFACLAGTLLYARCTGRSPMECFGDRANRWLVAVVRQERMADAGPAVSRAILKKRILIWVSVLAGVVAVLLPLGFNPFR